MERNYTLREMLEVLGRRRWLALGVAALALLVGLGVAFSLPAEYRAESVTQIEPHAVPADFFPQSVTSFEERMRTLKHGVLARPVLERVLRELDFYGKDWKRDPDEAVERLRRDVEVRLEGEVAGGPPSLLFVVEVRGPDRDKVARAADLIPRAYADMTREVLQRQAANLRDTLASQERDLAARLAAEERKLTAFKGEHLLEMPDANDANQRAASTLVARLDLHASAVADAQRRRTAALAAVPEAFTDAGLSVGNAEDVLRRLEAARAAYGPEHPEVRRLQRQWQEATARNGAEQQRFRGERLEGQVALIDAEVREHRAAMGALQRQLDAVQKRLESAPRWGEQYRVMARDYETLRAKYTTTLSRASDARAADVLLAADAPGLFRVVQPAVAPLRPAGPNRLQLALVALAAALGAALLALVVAEFFDTSLRGPQDADRFNVPVLATIPRIGPRRVTAGR